MTDGVLLLHGWPLDGSMWDEQVASLRDQVPVAAPSMPGFGGEPSAGDVMTMDAAGDAAVTAARAAGVDRFVVCGLSMGGYVALAIRRRHRDRVLGLVLANTRAGADDEAGKERRRALAARLLAEKSGFLMANLPPLLSKSAPPALWDRVRERVGAQPAASIAAASLGMAERPDSTADLAGIDVPVLVIASTGDRLIPFDATAPIAEQVPDGSLHVIEGAGHLSNLEAPQGFTRAVEGHLARCGLLPEH